MQPLVTFLHDDLRWSRRKAVLVTSAVIFLAAHVPILGLQSGALDAIDFWVGTFGVTLFALVETILFVWLFRPEHAWEEIHRGAQVWISLVFLWVLTYVTPLYFCTYRYCSRCRPYNTALTCCRWRACHLAMCPGDGGPGSFCSSFLASSASPCIKLLSQKRRQAEINDTFGLAVPHDLMGSPDFCHGLVLRQNLANTVPVRGEPPAGRSR
jgi:hypothetical protein